MPISVTVPWSWPPSGPERSKIMSPTWNGRDSSKTKPAKMLLSDCWPAMVMMIVANAPAGKRYHRDGREDEERGGSRCGDDRAAQVSRLGQALHVPAERVGDARGSQGQHRKDDGALGPGPCLDTGYLFRQVKLALLLQVHRGPSARWRLVLLLPLLTGRATRLLSRSPKQHPHSRRHELSYRRSGPCPDPDGPPGVNASHAQGVPRRQVLVPPAVLQSPPRVPCYVGNRITRAGETPASCWTARQCCCWTG